MRFKITENDNRESCLGKVTNYLYHSPVKGRNILKIKKNKQSEKVILSDLPFT
jgi:hypothetical protein